MNTIHDMGGMHGFGPVEPEMDEPVYHEKWESRVYAMQRALGILGLWTIDQSRSKLEAMEPGTYLGSSYYKRWYLGLEMRALEHGLVTPAEIEAGHALEAGSGTNRVFTAENVATMNRGNYFRPESAPAKFKAGDKVRTLNINPDTHTRLPRYARDKTGMVEACRGCHVYPDTVAINEGEHPQWLYTVVFSGQELWGAEADPSLKISIEAFEPYLIPA